MGGPLFNSSARNLVLGEGPGLVIKYWGEALARNLVLGAGPGS